jgi:hypothetical protein
LGAVVKDFARQMPLRFAPVACLGQTFGPDGTVAAELLGSVRFVRGLGGPQVEGAVLAGQS